MVNFKISVTFCILLLLNQGPEHVLRMHCSLKAYCATLSTPLSFGRSHFRGQISPRVTRRKRSKQRKMEHVDENLTENFA